MFNTPLFKLAATGAFLDELLGNEPKLVQSSGMDFPENSRERTEYSHIPSHNTQQKWRYTILHGPDGQKHLRVMAGGRVYGWKAKDMGNLQKSLPVFLDRATDIGPEEFELGGKRDSIGTLQVHRSTPESIYATMQDGRQNLTFNLQRGDKGQWVMVPKITKPKKPIAPEFIQAVQNATAH